MKSPFHQAAAILSAEITAFTRFCAPPEMDYESLRALLQSCNEATNAICFLVGRLDSLTTYSATAPDSQAVQAYIADRLSALSSRLAAAIPAAPLPSGQSASAARQSLVQGSSPKPTAKRPARKAKTEAAR